MRFSAFRSVFRFHVKRAPRKIVSHETYSLSLIFLPIFLHLRRYPPTCMKTDRAAPRKQGDLAHVCAVFSPLFFPGFSCTPLKTALILPPESHSSVVFLARHLAEAQSRSRRSSKRSFLLQHTPLRPPESLAFLEREPTPRRPFTPLRFRRILHCFT